MKSLEIAEFLNGTLTGSHDVEIFRVANLSIASVNDISFIETIPLKKAISDLNPSCLIVPEKFNLDVPFPFIAVKNPKLAFAQIAEVLHPRKKFNAEIDSSAQIARTAILGKEVFIGAFCCVGEKSAIGYGVQIHSGAKIGEHVTIGNNSIIHPNAVIEDDCVVGENVVLHSGVVIGADGFGYVRGDDRYVKFPQIGTVVIENNVEIGANSCIDRGALGETRIGEGTKIDNLVQIAHNVQIGKRVIIASQTGISGSTIIEDDCVIGGQVGMGDHATVKSGAIIGSQAGVLPGKIVRAGVWWGTPVQPLDEYKRQNAMVKGLARLRDEVKSLKKRLEE